MATIARYGSDKVGFLLIDGFDVLGVTTQIEDNLEALLEETTVLGDSWAKQVATGVKQASIAQEGYYDDAAGSSNDALCGSAGLSRLLCYGLQGNIIGKHFIGYSGAMQTNFTRIVSRGNLHRANASYKGNGEVEEGVILHPHIERLADGDTEGTPTDNSVATNDGGTAYLQLSKLVLGGYDNVAVKIRQSDDGISWDDLAAFTIAENAPAKERKSVTGAVKRYLAVSWAFAGTGSGPLVKFMVGFVRN
ncbi:MAG: hypothetical protein PHH26_03870 [Candidatus Thermoplasmatota archaeon]|nr:hypothetical protein [Candidatus Thermoplasmatota archaeon]